MLLTLEFVEPGDVAEVVAAIEASGGSIRDEGGRLAQAIREAADETDSLYRAMRDIAKAVDSDPDAGPFQRTTLTMVRDIAAKALNGGGDET